MPAHANTSPSDANADEIIHSAIACPQFTSHSPNNEHAAIVTDCEDIAARMPPAGDNTAGGMAEAQEDMYSAGFEDDSQKDKSETTSGPETSAHDKDDVDLRQYEAQCPFPADAQTSHRNDQLHTPPPDNIQPHTIPPTAIQASSAKSRQIASSRSCDHELDTKSDTKRWDFSRQTPSTSRPSSLFQPYAKYAGTQQSDRQIYNVTVTILTVDVGQCTLSGYLEICGLTPDHPKLTTFFTGEIIGGPDQKYSFRTKDPAWGASNKTDMTHWARFPSWRPLSPYAKNDIEFVHPVGGGDWWQEEHVFMRWKEHFLVPDHKLRSIQGASFEGFYYICLNQMQGSISGIYFHSKSEKYQQLELKHEGGSPAWGRGIRPAVGFR